MSFVSKVPNAIDKKWKIKGRTFDNYSQNDNGKFMDVTEYRKYK